MKHISRFLAAWQFLTVIAIPWRRESQAEQFGKCAGYFPLAGAFIGGILVGCNYLFNLGLPPAVICALLLAIAAILTGGLHLDGLADTCDGLGGYKTVEERLRIMRDSRVGGFGVIGIVLILLIKYVSLNSIPETLMTASLILMPVASRWAIVYAVFAYSYARPSGLGKAFKEGTGWLGFTLATIVTIAVAAVSMKFIGLAILGINLIIATALAAFFKKTFAGLTGDNYGAINEISEVSVLIMVNIFVHSGLL